MNELISHHLSFITTMTTFDINAYSRRGVDRKRNEDGCTVGEQLLYGQDTGNIQKTTSDTDLPFLICIADGMGGHKDGDVASRMAVEHVSNSFFNSKDKFDIEMTITNTHIEILSHNSEGIGPRAMGTTIVGAILQINQCTFFNVGDSRAYLIDNETIAQVSVDHISWGRYGGPYISQCLGGSNTLPPKPHIKTYDISPGNQLILVSDGITDAVADEKILEIILDGEPLEVQRLCDEAARLGGGDDASIIKAYVR